MKTIQIGKKELEPIEWTPYEGETVVVNTVIRQGQRTPITEFFEDRVKAVPQGNAYIIGNGPSRNGLDLNLLANGTGQTYGCNALYRDFIPDYLFMVDRLMSRRVVEDKVHEKTFCYAPSIEVTRHAYALHLIPNNPHWVSGQSAAHTACVHGHRDLYLIGFDFREYGKDQLNNIYQDTECYGPRHDDKIFEGWLHQFRTLIKLRPYCNFTIVHNHPPEYLHHLQSGTDLKNTRVIGYQEFFDTVLFKK